MRVVATCKNFKKNGCKGPKTTNETVSFNVIQCKLSSVNLNNLGKSLGDKSAQTGVGSRSPYGRSLHHHPNNITRTGHVGS